jgi:hypothetical protein
MNEFEIQTENKLKSINANSPVGALTQFLGARPLGSKNIDLIRRDLECFQNIIGKLQESDYDAVAKNLTENQAEILIDYLHRFMQYVGESKNEAITSGLMLKLYERIVKEYGPSIIIKVNSRSDTLVTRINNY